MEKLPSIPKTFFCDFVKAVSGELSEVKKIIEIFKNYGMIVVSKVPGCIELRKEICKVVIQLNPNHEQNNVTHTLGTRYFNGMVSHMNNQFISDTSQIASSLGFAEDYCPDLLKRTTNPNIQGYDEIEQKFFTFSRPLFLDFFKIVDHFFNTQQQNNAINSSSKQNNQEYESIHSIGLCSLVQKSRNIFLIPKQNQEPLQQQQQSVPWHFDPGLITMLLKEMYVIQDESTLSGYKEVLQPNCGAGLVTRTIYGDNIAIKIEEDEIIIQAGISLQLFSNNMFKAQIHCVQKPQDQRIGRISNAMFLYPPFDFKMETCDQNQTLEICKNDMNVLDPILKFSNHWKPGVQWIEFYRNQMLQFLLKTYITNYKSKNNITININVNHHTFETRIGKINGYQFNQLDSPMKIAKFWYKNYVSYKYSFIFIADQQTSCIDQIQNSQISPKGNCYVSYLIKLDSCLSNFITQLTAISVIDTIEQLINNIGKSENNTKPNLICFSDIHMNNKKLAGIFCESDGDFMSIGIEVYLNQSPNLEINTNIKQELNLIDDIDVIEFIRDLSVILMNNLDDLKQKNEHSSILQKIQSKLQSTNENVIFQDER